MNDHPSNPPLEPGVQKLVEEAERRCPKIYVEGSMGHLVTSLAAALKSEQAARREMARALKPFSDAADDLDCGHRNDSPIWECAAAMSITAGDLRRASILAHQDQGGERGD